MDGGGTQHCGKSVSRLVQAHRSIQQFICRVDLFILPDGPTYNLPK